MKYILIYFSIVFMLPVSLSYGQHFYRVEADFTIKEKYNDSLSQLTMGRVYFDQNQEKLLYDVNFPAPEIWSFQDTNFYRVLKKSDSVIRKTISPLVIQSSVFNMILSDQLSNYGLSDTLYIKSSTVNQAGMIITTLEPRDLYKKYLGNVLISRQGKLLQGIIIMTPEGEIASKQFFRDYDLNGGIPFPKEIIQLGFLNGKQVSTRITSFENIQFNADDSHQRYHYQLPAH